jgi:GntR family transcriptional regulator/MocR family aminotransferase
MLFNALRFGFMVLPERLVEAFTSARSLVDLHRPTLDQAILAEFITEGHFGHHLRHMRQTYAERIDVLKSAADKHLTGVLDVVRAGAGIRTLGWLKTWDSDRGAAQQAQKFGLEVTPLSMFTTKYKQSPALMLGFASCNPAELRRVSVLATTLRLRWVVKAFHEIGSPIGIIPVQQECISLWQNPVGPYTHIIPERATSD